MEGWEAEVLPDEAGGTQGHLMFSTRPGRPRPVALCSYTLSRIYVFEFHGKDQFGAWSVKRAAVTEGEGRRCGEKWGEGLRTSFRGDSLHFWLLGGGDGGCQPYLTRGLWHGVSLGGRIFIDQETDL